MLEIVMALGGGVIGWALKHYWDSKHYQLAVRQNVENWTVRVQEWSEEAISCLNRAHHVLNWTKDDPYSVEQRELREELALELSTLVEQGRLYFPNENRSAYGHGRQSARKGYRSAVLDPLVAAGQLLHDGSQLGFDLPDPKEKYGRNKYAKAIRLYSNAFLSFIEIILSVREGNRRRIDLVRKAGAETEAMQLDRLLFPSDEVPPPGHRYWLGCEMEPKSPSVEEVLGGQWQ
ncbi:hypothetical protein CK501_11150 [Halovibrio salipaludis]|uniref:Uncharacterized protein n=1 Tax=Halovibrio salipaludis TaxID=2032626 RepID=A0A2A2F5I8_9GAMM|nr:hypothetical protein [Halovibrio salipaludis]PAU80188.1 hypothetical protein CK501_11150 [Halovibrio salipaludis]